MNVLYLVINSWSFYLWR